MSDQPHPEEKYMHPVIDDPERYRRLLVMAALSIREYDHPDICRVLGETTENLAFSKLLSRGRKEIGLRLRSSRSFLEWSRLLPEQAPLHRAIRDHTQGIAIFELIDDLDDPDLDYQALWRSLCDTADLLMGAGAAGAPILDGPVAATLSAEAA